MRIIVFGTGTYYKRFKKYIDNEEIIFLVDNDNTKIGSCIDGIPICNPSQIERSTYDYVLILVKNYEPISKELVSKGIPKKKIITYNDVGEIFGIVPRVTIAESKDEEWSKWIQEDEKRTIVLFTDNFSRTGVPVATLNLAKLLKKMGYRPLCIAMSEGSLQTDIAEAKIPYICNFTIWSNGKTYLQKLERVHAIFVVSIVLSKLVLQLESLGRPIFWWMHESLPSVYEDVLLPNNKMQNICYLFGGRRVASSFFSKFGSLKADELNYFLPEIDICRAKKFGEKIKIAVIGAVCERKGQDICATAIRELRNSFAFRFEMEYVGYFHSKEFAEKVKEINPSGKMLGELSQAELEEYYRELDILVCPSRDDPMPIVVTQAMQNSVACIVSDQVGQSEYINNGYNGYVFRNEDIEELVEIIKELLICPQKIRTVGENGRAIYQQYFSEARMKNKLIELLERV